MKILATGTAGFIGYHFAKVANSACEAKFPRKKLLNINDYYDGNLKYEFNELAFAQER